MTREETKRDIHHLYAHWPDRTADSDSRKKALLFYEWLKSMDTGILSYGTFGDDAIFEHVAEWVEEWEKNPTPHRPEH